MNNTISVHGKSTESPKIDSGKDAMKQWLFDYRLLSKEIANEMERLDSLENRLYGMSSPSFNGMPHSSSPVYDKMTDMIQRKENLEDKIQGLITRKNTEGQEIEAMSESLRNPDERAVILMRYIDLEEWEDVQFMLYGSRSDYEEKFDNYRQRMFRLHSAAIEKLAELSKDMKQHKMIQNDSECN